ncbi:hypothetical protein AAII07_53810 [Microvirga sp. 0TCS3.31]
MIGLAPPYGTPALIVPLDLVHNATGRTCHRSGPGADDCSNRSAHDRASRGSNGRAG